MKFTTALATLALATSTASAAPFHNLYGGYGMGGYWGGYPYYGGYGYPFYGGGWGMPGLWFDKDGENPEAGNVASGNTPAPEATA